MPVKENTPHAKCYNFRHLYTLLTRSTCALYQDFAMLGQLLEQASEHLTKLASYYRRFESNEPLKNPTFDISLAYILDINPKQVEEVVQSFLENAYRGSKAEFENARSKTDKSAEGLLLDVWQFHRTEYLYLLKCLKVITTHQKEDFLKRFVETYNGTQIFLNVFKELEHYMEMVIPAREGVHLVRSPTFAHLWHVFHLKEQIELLQILVALDSEYHTENRYQTLLTLTSSIQKQSISVKISQCQHEVNLEVDLNTLNHLQNVYITSLLRPARKTILQNQNLASLDSTLNLLRRKQEYAPILLTYMMWHLENAPADVGKYTMYGETAVSARVLHQLSQILRNPVIQAHSKSQEMAFEVSYELFSRLLSQFEAHKLGPAEDQYVLLETLLSNTEIADKFWTDGPEKGLGLVLSEFTHLFPLSLEPLLRVFTALSRAGTPSTLKVIQQMTSLPCYVDTLENVPAAVLHTTTTVGQVRAQQTYHPFSHFLTLVVPAGTFGELISDGSTGVRWYDTVNGFHVLEAKIGQLTEQVARGVSYVKNDTMADVSLIATFLSTLLEANAIEYRVVQNMVEKLLSLLAKFVVIPSPPMELLAKCLEVVISAVEKDAALTEKMVLLRLLPYASFGLASQTGADVQPGLLWSHLEAEIVAGEFPLTSGLLRCLLTVQQMKIHTKTVAPGIVFVLTHISPAMETWRFVRQEERNKLIQDTLQLIHNALTWCHEEDEDVEDEGVLLWRRSCMELLCNTLAGAALLRIILTGQQTVSHAVLQNEALGGVVVRRVVLAFSILVTLLGMKKKVDHKELTPLDLTMIRSSNAAQSHLIHSIFNYIYCELDPRLPTLAYKLLKRMTTYMEVSFLSCLGTGASAIKRAVLTRLERVAEDMLLQEALMGFLSQCIRSQMGLLQLFLETEKDVIVFLDVVLKILQQGNELLKCASVELIYALWHQRCLQATQYLSQKGFWKIFCEIVATEPPKSDRGLRCAALAFKVIAIELYHGSETFDKDLHHFLQDWLSPSSTRLTVWSKNIVETLPSPSNGTDLNVTQAIQQSDQVPAAVLLLAGWRDLLAVLAARSTGAITLPLSLKHTLAADIRQAIEKRLTPGSSKGVLTTLVELYLLVLKSFKPADIASEVKDGLESIGRILRLSCVNFIEYPLRIQASLWTIFMLVLRHVKEPKNAEIVRVLEQWAEPLSTSLQLCLLPAQNWLVHSNLHQADITVACLALTCFWNYVAVISKARDESSWLPKLQERYILQNTLALTETALQLQKSPEFIQSAASFYVALAKGPIAAKILGSANLGVRLWLPLAALPESLSGSHAWREVYRSMTLFCCELLRQEKQFFWDEALNFLTVNENKLISIVLKIEAALRLDDLQLIEVFLCLLSEMLKYEQVWRLQHLNSLQISMRAVSVVIHCTTSYLIRPGFLQMMIEGSAHPQHLLDEPPNLWPVKDHILKEDEGSSRATTSKAFAEIQRKLIQLLVQGLSVVYSFSPSVSDLLSYEGLDVQRWERAVEPSFSTPSIQSAQDISLTFGTLSTAAGLALKLLLSKEKKSTEEILDLQLVLEQSSALLLSQAVLYLLDPQLSSHAKPQLRRELGTELGALMEMVKRSQKHEVNGVDRTFFKMMTHVVDHIFK